MPPSESILARAGGIGIVGGGIGGVATAVALEQCGIPATLYERAAEVREVGAGIMLWPNATRVLRELGVLENVIARSGRNSDFLVRAQDGRVLMSIPTGCFEVPALCTRRADLLAALLEKVSPASIRLGREFSRLERSPDSVRLHFKNGETREHAAVIGADGISSRVRMQLFGAIAPVERGYTVWRGVAPYSGPAIEGGRNSETWGRGQRFGILQAGDGRIAWYATANRDERDLLAAFRGWHAPVAELIRSTETILRNPVADLPPLRRWSSGRVTLLGDAAHPCTPNLGQGGCMAIEDALTLAKCLAHETRVEAAFERYEKLRRARTSHIQSRSRWIGRIGQFESRVFASSRDAVTSVLPATLFEYNLRRVYAYETGIG